MPGFPTHNVGTLETEGKPAATQAKGHNLKAVPYVKRVCH